MTSVQSLLRAGRFAAVIALSAAALQARGDDTVLVSVNALETASANASSMLGAVSADGHIVAFASTASDLAPGDGNELNDVFVRDLTAGTTALVSIDTAGAASGDNESFGPPNGPVLSASGRLIAFQSYAGNLVDLPTLGTTNIFIRDLEAGATTLASLDRAGTAGGNSGSSFPMLSADGERVVFQSNASDLVEQSTNGTTNAFVRDLAAGTALLSLNRSASASGDAAAFSPVISADGNVAAFVSFASDLTGVPSSGRNVFARDLTNGQTVLVSVNRDGTAAGNGDSTAPVLSADGRYVAFESSASDLVDHDGNGASDVFVRDLVAGTTMLVSVNRDGTASGNLQSSNPVISADGQRIAFVSSASDLVANDANGTRDVFVRDLAAGTTALVSANADGTASGNDASDSPTLSADGHLVAFVSFAGDLVANDTNRLADVFVRNLRSGVTTLISMNCAGTASGNDASGNPLLSADGRRVAFESFARDLVPDFVDGNGVFNMDVFSAAVPRPPCTGDCDDNGRVTVDELVQGVNIALANAVLATCPAFDADHSNIVTVDELVSAVNNALDGCPE
ncbi:MAG TPA: calcium-binding protein [Candidatus Kryptonia bacterium]|nr:calcium-binding protein [Candidatus Kryptonia bacterium]